MESYHSDESIDEPNAKRLKTESEDSTSSKPEAKDPFLSLPSDILAKIIGYIPIAQWPSLELLHTTFRANTLIAWRQLRNVNVDSEFIIKRENEDDGESTIGKSIVSIFQKLVDRSQFLTSLSGIEFRLDDEELCLSIVQLLANFEHLQSITMGDRPGGIQLERAVDFLESTRSRSSLKELHLYNVAHHPTEGDTILDRFYSSFANGRELQSPIILEKFTFASSSDQSLFIRLDTLDTTRLTDVHLAKAWVEPDQLASLIERSPKLEQIELSFMFCPVRSCKGPRLEAYKKLLVALAMHENLTASKFCLLVNSGCACGAFWNNFLDMLQSIGRRSQFRKLAMNFLLTPPITDIFSTICNYVPTLQSIKLHASGMSDGSIFNVDSLANLQEIHFVNDFRGVQSGLFGNAITKIAQLPHLKRLAFETMMDARQNSLKCLANISTLMDLRIRSAHLISADVLDKWSEGSASNLQILMLTEYAVEGVVRLLEKTVRLRVLILEGNITDQLLLAIAKSCPKLEVLGIKLDELSARFSPWNVIMVQRLQGIVDRCPNLKKLGGFGDEIRKTLRFPKYRKIGNVNTEFWNYDFDDSEYA